MSDGKTSHIMYFKEQVLRFAAAKIHKHSVDDIEDMNDRYAPVNHKSGSNTYGIGDSTHFGHLKIETEANENSNNAITNGAITRYVKAKIDEVKEQINNLIKFTGDSDTYSIVKSITNASTDEEIPTAKAVWDVVENYEDLLEGISLANPKKTNKDIDKIRDPGYYLEIGSNKSFSYGGEKINYTQGLIKVEKQANRVIQHVYATSKISGTSTYKINGSEYTRWGTSESDWKAWHVAHKPYTKTVRACNWGEGVDTGSVVVYENTAGFIIHWDQTKQANDRYPINASLYEYAKVCEFKPPLPIKGPYVFGNLIGRMDIKITSSKMEIRSTVPKDGRIIEMHETYFVPRNQ